MSYIRVAAIFIFHEDVGFIISNLVLMKRLLSVQGLSDPNGGIFIRCVNEKSITL